MSCLTMQNTNKLWHVISNNVVCATSKGSDQPAHISSLIKDFTSRSIIIYLLTYRLSTILEFLALQFGCMALSESKIVKIQHCWKSRRSSNKLVHAVLVLLTSASNEGSDELMHKQTRISFHCLHTQSTDLAER